MTRFLVLLCLTVGAFLTVLPALTKEPVTVVYIVRHAEKDLTPGLADPALTSAGEARALALRKQLQRRRPAALFTTDTKRTRSTLAPLAQATKLTPEVYDARQPAALAERIRREHAGEPVVVVGHSNTLLPLIEALGAKSPISEIKDSEYHYLFEVRIPASGAAVAKVSSYGAH
ncbi:histidine phosphatase family protein [Hymenobacter saemangeumensis]